MTPYTTENLIHCCQAKTLPLTHQLSGQDLVPERELIDPTLTSLTPAAVLVGVRYIASSPHIILLRRSTRLKHHAGQVGLPGGKYEPEDQSLDQTALRETYEETGIANEKIQLLTRLPLMKSGTGFAILPYIGLVDEDIELKPDPSEVDEIFEVPLDYAMDPGNYQPNSIIFNGGEKTFFETRYKNYHIWGITAAILLDMSRRIFNVAPDY